jgi:hypothetical protein
MLAGHSMVLGPGAEACEWCGRTWLSLLNDRDLWVVGATGIAHSGALNVAEKKELDARLERTWHAIVGDDAA